MLDCRGKRKVAAVPVAPKRFAEDQSPRDALRTQLRTEEDQAAKAKHHAQGSVYHHAKKLVGSSSGTTDDSSLSSDVELIISELENQVSDGSLNSTLRSGDSECSDLREAMKTVLERNRQRLQERAQQRKSLFVRVMQKISEVEQALPLRTAVLCLVPDLAVRQDFLKVLDDSSQSSLRLLYTRGRVAGVYAQEKGAFRRLFGVENAPSLVKEKDVRRWLAWGCDRLRAADKLHAIAFDL